MFSLQYPKFSHRYVLVWLKFFLFFEDNIFRQKFEVKTVQEIFDEFLSSLYIYSVHFD